MNSVEINDKALALLRGEKVYASDIKRSIDIYDVLDEVMRSKHVDDLARQITGDAKNGTVNPVFIAAAIELARYHFDVSPKPKTIGEMLAPDILY
jgi:hypothetical protein